MDSMVAPCGLDCAKCDAYVATQKNDRTALAALAVKWAKEYHGSFTAETVRCDGCHAVGGVQVGHCSECKVRLCAVGKGYKTCAECADFGCEKLAWFFTNVPGTKERLEALRKG
jgi:hypothetical protein